MSKQFHVYEYDFFYNDFLEEISVQDDFETAVQLAKKHAEGWCEDEEPEVEEHGRLTFVKTGCDFGVAITDGPVEKEGEV